MTIILLITLIITTVKYPNPEFVSPDSFLLPFRLGLSPIFSLSINLYKSSAHH
jgi:hypothetical protein